MIGAKQHAIRIVAAHPPVPSDRCELQYLHFGNAPFCRVDEGASHLSRH